MKALLATIVLLCGLTPAFSQNQTELTFWNNIKESTDAAKFEAYLKKYPNGAFQDLARIRLNKLAGVKQISYKPGDTFKDCDDCPEMVVVPPGEFMMGSPKSEKMRGEDEDPRRKVTIANKFAVGKFEVTFSEWDACVKGSGCNGYKPREKGWGRGNRPVINVNWYDAKAYVTWLSHKTKQTYRLLSEAEWEYVARANTDTPFWWGNSISTAQANYDGNDTYNGTKGKFRVKTLQVDSFKANNFGLYNVHGNVWEWVEDCWHKSYHGAPKDGTAWLKGGDCKKRILRGGSWYNNPDYLRSANRNWDNATNRYFITGFRVARALAAPAR